MSDSHAVRGRSADLLVRNPKSSAPADVLTESAHAVGEVQIRPYRAADERAVQVLWNTCLARDEISLTIFRRKVILDPNFDERGCFVAEVNGSIIGFLLSIRRRYPYNDLGLEQGKGWITAFFVAPAWQRRGVASDLLARAEDFLVRVGVHEVFVSDYTPNYFIPGVDLDAYNNGYLFLRARGFKKVQNVYSMGRSLMDFRIPAETEEVFHKMRDAGYVFTTFEPSLTLKVLEFLRQHHPGDLFRVALERLTENPECDEIFIALKNDQVVGFSHFMDERFGPFRIHPDDYGRGLGPLLYYYTVDHMRQKGKRNLWLAWTTGRAKDFYSRVGLKVLRRHVIMKKDLSLGKTE
jgi:GNAT superfamily N-acetyltransferase